ncbi:MAG: hypothetical protein HC875_41665 [Anaerolineales bacterium]|nr:hypothetical protein [Anaerolineales bacterium]
MNENVEFGLWILLNKLKGFADKIINFLALFGVFENLPGGSPLVFLT